ncbi:hypothetical protein DPMN_116944 [Dreissena polymorpha]|uniref:Uncharacterized protein n=1 Tax=Dreissena polymorpha TaxID=45954 RepID=A0A9D4KPG1_DREPO|nr:hypothetical protein DPMN_116944 [Dreissena polymorpha]
MGLRRSIPRLRPGPHVGRLLSLGEKIVRPVRDSNPGFLAYRESAFPAQLYGPPHTFSPNVTKFRP